MLDANNMKSIRSGNVGHDESRSFLTHNGTRGNADETLYANCKAREQWRYIKSVSLTLGKLLDRRQTVHVNHPRFVEEVVVEASPLGSPPCSAQVPRRYAG